MDERSSRRRREADLLLSLAEEYLEDEQPSDALTSAKDALQVFDELDDSRSLADCMRILVAAHCSLGSASDGKREMQPFWERARSSGDKRSQGCLLCAMADVMLASDRTDACAEAVQCYSEARECFIVAGDVHMEIFTMLAKVKAQLDFRATWGSNEGDQLENAAEMSQEALDLAKEAGNEALEGKCWRSIARVHTAAGRRADSIAAAKDAITLFRKLLQRKEEAVELQFVASLHLESGEPREAAAQAECALKLLSALGGPAKLEASAMDVKIKAKLELGSKEEALVLAQEAVESARSNGVTGRAVEGSALRCLADCYLSTEDREQASTLIERAIFACRRSKDAKAEATCFVTLAKIHAQAGQWDASMQVNGQAVAMLTKVGDVHGANSARHWMIDRLILAAQVSKAFACIQDALMTCRETGDSVHEAEALMSAATLYRQQENFSKVIAKAELAKELFHMQGKLRAEARASIVIAEALQAEENQTEAAAAWSEAVTMMKDVGDNIGAADAILGLHTCYLQSQHFKAASELVQEEKPVFAAAGKYGKRLEAQMFATSAQQHLRLAIEDANARKADHKDYKFKEVAVACLDSARMAVAAAKKGGDNFLVAFAQLTLAQVYIAVRKPHDAFRILHEATALLSQLKVPALRLEAQAHMLRSEAHALLGRQEEASEAGDLALELLRRLGNHSDVEHASMLIKEIQGRSFGDEASTTADSGDHAPVEEWDLGSMEKKMQEIAARTLGGRVPAWDAPLAEAGIDSLLALEFTSRLSKALSLSITVDILERDTSLRDVAAAVWKSMPRQKGIKNPSGTNLYMK